MGVYREFSLNWVRLKYNFNFYKTHGKIEKSPASDFDDFEQTAMKKLYAENFWWVKAECLHFSWNTFKNNILGIDVKLFAGWKLKK